MHAQNSVQGPPSDTDIAIVGMAARLPGARTLAEFWQNLATGTESITLATDEELLRAGTPPALLGDSRYVRARSRLHDVELFDAGFFGFSAREAEITDPQQRLFLECAWEALEHAGHADGGHQHRIGVYAGASLSTYLLYHLLPHPELLSSVGEFEALTANDKDYLATRVSYKLDLRGPSIAVQTACSTSLVAVHLACQSLIGGECDLALAGGATVVVPQQRGYVHRPGGIMAPDGHCRAFDAAAGGTVFGNGVGIVVLRRLQDALADGDSILAVVKGSAVNNDGAGKIGYTAPSVDGQAAVISEALAVAGVDAATIGYVEAHGTGTLLGDPIEVAALSRVFAAAGVAPGSCALGSVKTNVGHLDAAAGVTGLIKVVLALQAQAIPATLHFERGNPEIDFTTCPFYVNGTLRPWPPTGEPRRAGVSSFGIGGTNAHVVLEEAPERPAPTPSRSWQLLLTSAKSASALRSASTRLREALEQLSDEDLPDVAYTLQVGRKRFNHRQMALVRDRNDALSILGACEPERAAILVEERDDRPVVFMFPGQGAQHTRMAAGLYDAEPLFREQVDRCAEILVPMLRVDVRSVLFAPAGSDAANQLDQTEFSQPALFVVEYALAEVWKAWGVRPRAMIGHSLGEYVAACLSGVFSLDEALALVARRARLLQSMPAGAMLAVAMPEHELAARVREPLSLAAVNGPHLSVVSGPANEIAAFDRDLVSRGTQTHRLRTSHAFHSSMMDGAVTPLTEEAAGTARRPPTIPFVSNVTGEWFSEADARDPAYWGRHLRQPVRFGEGLSRLLAIPDALFLEVGPGRSLSAIRRSAATHAEPAYPSLRHESSDEPDQAVMLTSLGRLWLSGARIGWPRFSARDRRCRLPLPTYPFERRHYWIEPPSAFAPQPEAVAPGGFDAERVGRAEPPVVSMHPRPLLRTLYVAPETELETVLTGIWENLLGTAPIGVHDNFFELGGNSLMATRLVSRLRETFPLEVPLRGVFEARTVAELSRLLDSLLSEKIESLSEAEAERLLTGIGSTDESLTQ